MKPSPGDRSEDFFRMNRPEFSPETADLLRDKYMEHFRQWRVEYISLWLKNQIDSLEIKLNIEGSQINTLIDLARKDVEMALKTDPSLNEKWASLVIWHYPGFEAITVQRLAHYLYSREIQELPRALTESVHRNTGIDIHPWVEIGESFFADHWIGIVVGETAVIGDGVVLYQGVTLGNSHVPSRNQEWHKRHPTLENGVTVCAGAMVLWGNTVIGSNSTIWAGTIITQSIPSDSLVVRGENWILKVGRKKAKS